MIQTDIDTCPIILFYKFCRFGRERFKDIEVDENSSQEHAVLVALGLVYYLRLNEKYRERYKKDLKKTQIRAKTVDEALKEEVGFNGQNR